jgi:hypothetical protein
MFEVKVRGPQIAHGTELALVELTRTRRGQQGRPVLCRSIRGFGAPQIRIHPLELRVWSHGPPRETQL